MNILDLEMQQNEADAKTIRDYLKKCLSNLWKYEDSFSGKRPFGESGWKMDIYATLAKHKLIEAELNDEYGYIEDISGESTLLADKLIMSAIESL